MLSRLLLMGIVSLLSTPPRAQQNALEPPGRMVDVAGFRLHIDCTGPDRGPSVVLIAGIGDYSFDWALVQSQVQTDVRVCSYDRQGMAWSERDPVQPDLNQGYLSHVAQQLVDLLRSAQVPPPYVFVGHSWGGAIARVGASLISRDVAGMVLVDSTHEDEILGINNTAVRPRRLSAAEWEKIWNAPMPAPGAPPGPKPGPVTVKRPAPSIKPPYTHLPPEVQAYRLWARSRPRPIDGGDFRADLTTLFESRHGEQHPLDDLPLIVITPMAVDYDAEPGFTPEELKADHLRLQADLATLSRRGKQVFAQSSGHSVQLDEPAIVVSAIQDVVRRAQASSERKHD